MTTNIYQARQGPSISSQCGGEGDGQTVDVTEKAIKAFRGILNKLAPENFESLMRQVDELNINDEETLKTIVELLVEKALFEQSYNATYAKLCHHLKGLRVSSSSSDGFVLFHKLLLTRCQMEFQNRGLLRQKENDVSAVQEDVEETRHKVRVRLVATVSFIGELFKVKMLWEPIIHTCVNELLKDDCEDSLECMCRLLSTVGKGLNTEAERPKLDRYCDHICLLLKEKKMSSRIKFMLQDIVDLKKNNWVPSRTVEGPKTIQQLHQEVKEAEEKEQLQLKNMQTAMHWRDRGRAATRGPSFNMREVPRRVNQDSSRDCEGERKQRSHLGSSSCRGVGNIPVERKTPPTQAGSSSEPSYLESIAKKEAQVQVSHEEQVYQALKRLLQRNCINDNIEEWIQDNLNDRERSSDSVVRALIRAVCQSVIVNCGVYTIRTYDLFERVSLLKRFITDDHKQLVALNALQQLVVHIDQPDGLLRMFFDVLLDEEVIQDEMFFKWKSSAASVRTVYNFFTWLQEANRRIK